MELLLVLIGLFIYILPFSLPSSTSILWLPRHNFTAEILFVESMPVRLSTERLITKYYIAWRISGGDQETKPGCRVTRSSAAGQWLSPRPETVLPQTIVATTCLQHLELQELDITVFRTVSPEEQNISQHIAISLSDAFHHSKCNFLPEHGVSSCMKGLNIFSSSIPASLPLSLPSFFLFMSFPGSITQNTLEGSWSE